MGRNVFKEIVLFTVWAMLYLRAEVVGFRKDHHGETGVFWDHILETIFGHLCKQPVVGPNVPSKKKKLNLKRLKLFSFLGGGVPVSPSRCGASSLKKAS